MITLMNINKKQKDKVIDQLINDVIFWMEEYNRDTSYTQFKVIIPTREKVLQNILNILDEE